jgi:hypothetical protein
LVTVTRPFHIPFSKPECGSYKNDGLEDHIREGTYPCEGKLQYIDSMLKKEQNLTLADPFPIGKWAEVCTEPKTRREAYKRGRKDMLQTRIDYKILGELKYELLQESAPVSMVKSGQSKE